MGRITRQKWKSSSGPNFRAGVKFNKTYLKLESSNKYQSKRYSEIRIAYGRSRWCSSTGN